jgi:hypothetical protein
MDRLVEFDPACFDVLFQKIMDRDDLVLLKYLRIPVLQTKPGRIVGMASLG